MGCLKIAYNEQGFVSVWALKNYCSTLAQMPNRKQKVELLPSAHIAQNPLLCAATGGKKKYQIIYADPPWEYKFAGTRSEGTEDDYPTMKTKDICAFNVAELADDNWYVIPTYPNGYVIKQYWINDFDDNSNISLPNLKAKKIIATDNKSLTDYNCISCGNVGCDIYAEIDVLNIPQDFIQYFITEFNNRKYINEISIEVENKKILWKICNWVKIIVAINLEY